jgi:hypothetical protein
MGASGGTLTPVCTDDASFAFPDPSGCESCSIAVLSDAYRLRNPRHAVHYDHPSLLSHHRYPICLLVGHASPLHPHPRCLHTYYSTDPSLPHCPFCLSPHLALCTYAFGCRIRDECCQGRKVVDRMQLREKHCHFWQLPLLEGCQGG